MRRDWLEQAARRGTEAALRTLAEAARERTPVETGRLRASCRVELEKKGRGGTVRFDAPYAAARHAAGAAFLADAVKSPAVRARMAEKMARAMGEKMR